MRAALYQVLQPMEARDIKGHVFPAVTQLAEIDARCWAGELHTSAAAIARTASQKLPGQWWAGNGVVTWNNGGRCWTLLSRREVEAVQRARAVGATLMGEVRSWTVGGVARQLLAWLGPPQPHRAITDRHLSGVPWSYRVCRPGSYPDHQLVDLVAAYHQGLSRLPSIRLTWGTKGPIWHPMRNGERERWRDLLAAVTPLKPLRLVLLGNMVGGGKLPVVYVKGQRMRVTRRYGPFRSAGLAVVRAGYELCWLAATEAHTAYANTDSVLLKRTARPQSWERWGYAWRVAAEGDADVKCLDVLKVGERMTAWYRQGSRFVLPFPATPDPPRLTLTAWH